MTRSREGSAVASPSGFSATIAASSAPVSTSTRAETPVSFASAASILAAAFASAFGAVKTTLPLLRSVRTSA